jgi:hypothetical protein
MTFLIQEANISIKYIYINLFFIKENRIDYININNLKFIIRKT